MMSPTDRSTSNDPSPIQGVIHTNVSSQPGPDAARQHCGQRSPDPVSSLIREGGRAALQSKIRDPAELAPVSPAAAQRVLRSEEDRILLLSHLFGTAGCLAPAVLLLGGGRLSSPDLTAGNPLGLGVLWAATLCYEVACVLLLHHHIGSGQSSPRGLRLLSCLVEPTALTGALLLGGPLFIPGSMLDSPVLFVYPLIVLLSSLRLSWKLCLLTSLVVATEYLFLIAWFLPQAQTSTPDLELFFFPVHGVLAAIYLSSGLVAALVAHTIGNGLQRSGHTLLALETESARKTRLEDLSQVATGLAQETRAPLKMLQRLARTISRGPDIPRENRVAAERIEEAAKQATARLERFQAYANRRSPNIQLLDLQAVVNETLSLLQAEAVLHRVEVYSMVPAAKIAGDVEMLQQILVNLIQNSLQASAPGDRIVVGLETAGGSGLNLLVRDWGKGVLPHLQSEIFKPYVTDRSTGNGLGLAIVRQLVEQLGWRVELSTEPGGGTTVTISGLGTDPGSGNAPLPSHR